MKKIFFLFVCILFIFSLVTKLHNLGVTSFEFDEIYSAKFTTDSWTHIIFGTRYDPGNPPGYFAVLKAWKNIFGNSDYTLRLFSVVAYCFGFIALYQQTRKHLGYWPTITVLALFSGSGLILHLAQFVRAYSLLLCISIALFPLFLDYIAEKKFINPTFCIICLLSWVGFWSHYSFVLYYFFLCITILFHIRSSKQHIRKFFFVTSLTILGYLPWIVFFIRNQLTPPENWYRYSFNQLQMPWVGFNGWLSILTNTLSTKLFSPIFQSTICIFLFVLLTICLITAYQKTTDTWKKNVIFFFLLSFSSVLFTPLHQIFNNPRYTVFILPFFFLSLGILLDMIKYPWLKLSLVAVLILYSLCTYSLYNNPTHEDWKGLVFTIPLNASDSIILHSPCDAGFSFDYYYRGLIPQYCFSAKPTYQYLPSWNIFPYNTIYIIFFRWETDDDKKLFTELTKTYSLEQKYFGSIQLMTLRRKE